MIRSVEEIDVPLHSDSHDRTPPENQASIRVAGRIGERPEGRMNHLGMWSASRLPGHTEQGHEERDLSAGAQGRVEGGGARRHLAPRPPCRGLPRTGAERL